MKKIRQVADRYGLIVVEDAAHCIEGVREGVRVGELGDAACFSFYATKNITSGEGGAIAINNSAKAELIRMLRLHGIDKSAVDRYTKKYEHWDIRVLGWKYNMDNIQAALLLGQLDRIETQWKRMDEIGRRYEDAFGSLKDVKLMADGSRFQACETSRYHPGPRKKKRRHAHDFTGERDRSSGQLQSHTP